MSEAGKGSTQRPRSVADEEWAANYRNIFGESKLEKLLRKQKENNKDAACNPKDGVV